MAYSLKEQLSKEERFVGGHRLCAGCGAGITVRAVLRALDDDAAPVLHRRETVDAAVLRRDVEPLEVQKDVLQIKCPPSCSGQPSARR